ncbi:MAG TPA: ABC transporter permease [Candidatus Korarchaeota archaeon]|nr:ABC transporter permease [Candidatus Korarchaeota archaeon]
MKPSLGIAKKDFLLFIRDRAALFWVIIFPLLMMLLFSAVFGGEGAKFDVACVNNDKRQIADLLIEAMNSTGVVTLHLFESQAKAFEMVRAGEQDLIGLLVIPEGFTDNLTSGRTGNLEFFVREEDPTVQQMLTSFISGFVEEFNSRFRRELIKEMLVYMPENMSFGGYSMTKEEMVELVMSIARPINVTVALISKPEVTSDTVAYWENKGHWVSTMFTYSFLFSGMVTSTGILVEEKERKTLKRLRLAPASIWSLLIGKILSALIVLSFSQLVLIASTILVLRPEVNWDLTLLPLVFMGDVTGISLGLLLAEISPSSRAAGQAAVVIGVLLQFLVGMYFPVQFLPGFLRTFAELLPFTKAAEALDRVLLGGATISEVIQPCVYLGISAISFTTIAVILFPRWAREE